MSTDNTTSRRKFLKTTGVTAAVLSAGCTGESDESTTDGEGGTGNGDDDTDDTEEFPSRDMRILIPYGPGGGYDEYTRLTAQYMEEYVPDGVNVQPQNMEGADGQIATGETYRSDPDGYTTMLVNVGNFVQQQILYDVDFDLTEMTWLPQITTNTPAIGVGTNSDIDSWDDLVEATQNDDAMWTTSGGPTATGVVGATLIGELGGLYTADNILDNFLTFDSRGEAIQAILAENAQVMPATYDSLLPYVDSGDLEIVMTVTTDDPPERTPGSDTLSTAGVPNAEEIADSASAPRIFAGPPDIPDDRAQAVRDLYSTVINDDEFIDALEDVDRAVVYEDSERAEQIVLNTFDTWEEQGELLRQIAGED